MIARRLGLRWSWPGAIVAGIFLLLFLAALAWLMYSSATNPADSGEGGVLLLLFALPWAWWMPHAWLNLASGIGAVLLNAALLYLLFGGLRSRKPGSS